MAKRDGSIRLHAEFGLNPTLIKCSWCGKDTGDIALLGAAYKGQAPMRMSIDEAPCSACRAGMGQGITFIEMTYEGSKTRTGRWCVMQEDGLMECLDAGPLRDHILASRMAFITLDVAEKLGLFNETVAEG